MLVWVHLETSYVAAHLCYEPPIRLVNEYTPDEVEVRGFLMHELHYPMNWLNSC